VPFVENFAHSYIYELGPESVRSIAERSSHALGDVESHEQLPVIENFHTPFALEHLFHWYVEKHRAVPTWREFRNWMVAGEAAPHWYLLLRSQIGANPGEQKRRAWSRAARWRLGKFYMPASASWICWQGSALMEPACTTTCLPMSFSERISGPAIKLSSFTFLTQSTDTAKTKEGRKPPAEKFFKGSNYDFNILHLPVTRQGAGNVWLATEESGLQIKDHILLSKSG